MTEEQVRAEGIGIDEVLKELLLLFLVRRRLEIVRLIQHAEFAHQTLAELCLRERRPQAGETEAEQLRVAQMRPGNGVEADKALIMLLDRHAARLREGMHETNSGIEQCAQLVAVVLADADVVTEIVSAGDAVQQVVERAVESKPVEVFIRRSARVDQHRTNPTRRVLIGAQSTQRALPDVAVRGDEARDDYFAGGVERGRCAHSNRRCAGRERCDPAVVADEHVADDRRGLSRLHGQEGGVRDEQAGAGERHKTNRRSHERHRREQPSQKRRNTLRNASHAHHSHSGAAHINARAGAWVGAAANGGVSRPRPRWRNNGIT